MQLAQYQHKIFKFCYSLKNRRLFPKHPNTGNLMGEKPHISTINYFMKIHLLNGISSN